MSIEIKRHDWKKLRAAVEASEVPQAIEQLRLAKTEEEADSAYWKIDNVVVLQGALFESAEFAIPAILEALYDCSDIARPKFFYLLFILGGGCSCAHPREIELGNNDLRDKCHNAVKLGTSLYFYYLENGTSEEKGFCADLLELCSQDDNILKNRVIWLIKELSSNEQDSDLIGIYEECLSNLI